jgi:hypothetical protein
LGIQVEFAKKGAHVKKPSPVWIRTEEEENGFPFFLFSATFPHIIRVFIIVCATMQMEAVGYLSLASSVLCPKHLEDLGGVLT